MALWLSTYNSTILMGTQLPHHPFVHRSNLHKFTFGRTSLSNIVQHYALSRCYNFLCKRSLFYVPDTKKIIVCLYINFSFCNHCSKGSYPFNVIFFKQSDFLCKKFHTFLPNKNIWWKHCLQASWRIYFAIIKT